MLSIVGPKMVKKMNEASHLNPRHVQLDLQCLGCLGGGGIREE